MSEEELEVSKLPDITATEVYCMAMPHKIRYIIIISLFVLGKVVEILGIALQFIGIFLVFSYKYGPFAIVFSIGWILFFIAYISILS